MAAVGPMHMLFVTSCPYTDLCITFVVPGLSCVFVWVTVLAEQSVLRTTAQTAWR
jgi:hypothetical protein